jgi:hypothetical protein
MYGVREIIDIEYTEFFDVGDKVCLANKCGVVVKTYDLDEGVVVGGELIICWDIKIECDYEVVSGEKENFLFKIEDSYEFEYINDDGTTKDKD